MEPRISKTAEEDWDRSIAKIYSRTLDPTRPKAERAMLEEFLQLGERVFPILFATDTRSRRLRWALLIERQVILETLYSKPTI